MDAPLCWLYLDLDLDLDLDRHGRQSRPRALAALQQAHVVSLFVLSLVLDLNVRTKKDPSFIFLSPISPLPRVGPSRISDLLFGMYNMI